MKKLLLFFFSVITLASAQVDVGVFYTYDDFVEDKYDPMVLDHFHYGLSGGTYTFYDAKSGRHTFSGKEIWGFTTPKGIFRMDPDRHIPLMIVALGEVVLYLDQSIDYKLDSAGIHFQQEYQGGLFGDGGTDSKGNERVFIVARQGYPAYVSRDLTGKVYTIYKGTMGEVKFEAFAPAFSGLNTSDLESCLAKHIKNHAESIRCILHAFPPEKVDKGGGRFIVPEEAGIRF
jgi:hypothetical protein